MTQSPLRMTRLARPWLLALGLALASVSGAALAREPMKIDGSSLDQRILTRPGAVLQKEPAAGAEISKPPVFSTYYVFARKDEGGVHWVEIGANRDGAQTGWMRADQTVDWKHTTILAFTNPEARIPVLFFEDRPSLKKFLKDEMMSTRAELLAQSAQGGNAVASSGVVAMEPEALVSITQQFYMLPVLEADRIRVNNRMRRIVKVASINKEAMTQPAPQEPFRVGVVFVVDTSVSMGPYIERTKKAIASILKGLNTEEERERISFGMVGFRSDVRKVPGLEYTAKEFYPLKRDFDEAAFFRALEGMKATTVSSHNFDEDGLSGLALAAEMPGWSDFDGRYIIYISDAGMLVGDEQGSTAGTTPKLFATRARGDLGIATFSMFLKTRAGRAYHEDALRQLDEISRIDMVDRPLVYPIEDGGVEQFGRTVDQLTASLLAQVRQTEAARPPAAPACASDSTDVTCAASQVGRAMRLAWLGRQQQTQAPEVYEAWAADFALDDPGRWAMNARVLLTRNQLNDLYVTLQALVEAFKTSSDTDPAQFFSILKTTLAHAMRDPSRLPALDSSSRSQVVAVSEFDDLGDLLGEYFRDLPYTSDLGSTTQDTWLGMGDSGRRELIEGVKAKLAMYEFYYADKDNWVSINDAAGEGEKVYPIPLEMMP